MIGQTLGHYLVEGRLGAGGMGEVYRARDTRLGRSVAIKVLPEVFAQDPERVARFDREARVLAALNHANIAALFGFEEQDQRHFLVMELIEGQTLAERIASAPVTVEETLKIAHQIAEALEAAHEKGIVHRDLKPANVKITPEGKVKVLDFGLAKAMEATSTNTTMSNSPTLSLAATNAGVILGTAAYMSPEQAKGFEADQRSDIFSFGCILYEMLTGRQPFQGDTVAEVLAGVLAREPDLTTLPTNLNPRIVELLRRCLEKNPKKRWHAVADTRVEIDAITSDPRGLVIQPEPVVVTKPLWKRAISIAAALLIGGVIAGSAAWYLKPAPQPMVARFPFVLADGQQFTNAGRQLIAVSPDGTQFVYVANQRLYLKPMRELNAIPIQGTEISQGVLNPVFSADGKSLAFWSAADQSYKRIAVSGGAPVTITAGDPPFGVSWSANDEILFGTAAKGIMRVPAKGGKPETIVTVKPDEAAHGPQALPDGQSVLFTLAGSSGGVERWDKAKIVVENLKTHQRKTLIEGGTDGRYVPTGHIVFALSGNLLAVPFDLKKLEVTGGPVPIVEGVRTAGANTGSAHFGFSDTGALVYIPGTGATGVTNVELVLVDRAGMTKKLGLPTGPYSSPRMSPNGKQLAFAFDDGKEQNIFIWDLAGTTSMRRLTFGGKNYFPLWSGDGERVLYRSDRENGQAIYSQRADGTGTAERITPPEIAGAQAPVPNSWSTKNQMFSFMGEKNGDYSVWTYSIPDKKFAIFFDAPSSAQNESAFSPDGKWIAYHSNESGRYDVYVQPVPATGAKFQITRPPGAQGHHPLWSPDGKELFYMSNQQLFSVAVQTQNGFTFGNPIELPIKGISGTTAGNRLYDLTPDGKQFLVMFPPGQSQADGRANLQIQVVLNWFEELKQRVGSK